jgi:hypothetical protein
MASAKIAEAIEEIGQQIAKKCHPDSMTGDEADDFLYGIIERCQQLLNTLED